MKEIKYTSDGKKVLVVENLCPDFLVKEICVNSVGKEIISETNFITKSLFNEPVETWESRRKKEEENHIKKLKEIQNKLYYEIRDLENKKQGNAELLKRSNFLKDKLPEFNWNDFVDALCGNIKWIIKNGYDWDWTKPVAFDSKEGLFEINEKKYEGLRAIEVRGKYDRWTNSYSPEFRINYYSDGSGNSNQFIFFKNDKELRKYLLAELKRKHIEKKVGFSDLVDLKKFIKIPTSIKKEIINEEKERQARYAKSRQEDALKAKKALADKIAKLNNKIENNT